MPRIIEGGFEAKDITIALVAARFNDFIVNKLVDGAIDALTRHGAAPENIRLVRVPGSFEIPAVARKLAHTGAFDAVVCLGCVIRGGTDHYTYIAAESAKGIAQVALAAPIPVIYGVITADSIEQAIERAGTKMGNKGADAAMSAIELVNLGVELDKTLE